MMCGGRRSSPRPPPRCRCPRAGPAPTAFGPAPRRDRPSLKTGWIPRPVEGGWSSQRDAPGRRAGPLSVAHGRRARRPPNRKGRAASPTEAVAGIRRHSRRRVADRIHPGEQFRPGKREQYPVGLGIADLDSLDVDRERRRARQHELIRDVEAPVGAAHGARAREHRRREPGELLAGIDPRHIAAGVSRSPRLRRGRYRRHRDQRKRHARNGGGTAKLGRHPCPSLSGHAGIARLQANLHPAFAERKDCDRITCDANSILLLSRESRSGDGHPIPPLRAFSYSQNGRPLTGWSRPLMPAQSLSLARLCLSSSSCGVVGQFAIRPPKHMLLSS